MTLEFAKPYIDSYDGEPITYEEMLTKMTHRELRYNLKTKWGIDLRFLDLKKAYETENSFPEMMHWAPNQDGSVPGSGKSGTAQSIGQENAGIPECYDELLDIENENPSAIVGLEEVLPDVDLSPEEIVCVTEEEEEEEEETPYTWADYTGTGAANNNNLWNNGAYMDWDGVKFVQTGPGPKITPRTGWPYTTGFYPTKIRVTYSAGTGAAINVKNVAGDSCGSGNPDSGEEMNISMAGTHIGELVLGNTTNVTKIEFYAQIHAV